MKQLLIRNIENNSIISKENMRHQKRAQSLLSPKLKLSFHEILHCSADHLNERLHKKMKRT